MKSTRSENPLRVLLGTSFALFLGMLLAIPLAYLGVALYLSVTGVQLPLEVSPAVSMWELRLEPERSASDEHERLVADLEEALPEAKFRLSERGSETWLVIHARDEAVFAEAGRLTSSRGYNSGVFRLPTPFDCFHPSSLEAAFAWFGDHPAAIMAATSSPSLSFGCLGLVLGFLARKRSFVWASAPASVGRRVCEGVLGGFCLLAAASLLSKLFAWLGRPIEEQAWVSAILERGGESAWVLWLVAVGFAPIAEELFFRGYLFQSLDVRISRPVALAVSTAYFAGVHGNPSGLPVYVLLGVGLAVLHARTRSLTAPILAHALVNASALLLN